ncbi:alanine racemase [Patescibacteria group bacterium]|nr:alanine racemase [Patescibacteria group bacterium]
MQKTIRSIARKIRRKFETHRPIVEVGISRANLLHNLRTYRERYPDVAFAPVLKSNAYGHGLCVIAELLDKENIAFFAVDSFYEARTLRRAGIQSRILIIGYVRPEEINNNRLQSVDYGIIDIIQLQDLVRIATKPIRIHLKIDTGMHRQGILPQDLEKAIVLIKSNSHLSVVGICSHFADAENSDQSFTQKQIAVWKKILPRVADAFPTTEYRHMPATKGIPLSGEMNVNVIRLGIGLYGFDTSLHGDLPLMPVLEMRSLISSVREIQSGESVGYNATHTATQTSKIATVPAGYFEGVDRQLSNVGAMQVRGQSCAIAGRVSMNMSSIEVTHVHDVAPGDVVTVISRNSSDINSVEKMAELSRTTPYVILVHIPQHLKRIVE